MFAALRPDADGTTLDRDESGIEGLKLPGPQDVIEQGTQFTCSTCTKVQILTHKKILTVIEKGTEFTCFTSTKVQILTPEEPEAEGRLRTSLKIDCFGDPVKCRSSQVYIYFSFFSFFFGEAEDKCGEERLFRGPSQVKCRSLQVVGP